MVLNYLFFKPNPISKVSTPKWNHCSEPFFYCKAQVSHSENKQERYIDDYPKTYNEFKIFVSINFIQIINQNTNNKGGYD